MIIDNLIILVLKFPSLLGPPLQTQCFLSDANLFPQDILSFDDGVDVVTEFDSPIRIAFAMSPQLFCNASIKFRSARVS
jgi:hypothetical protein